MTNGDVSEETVREAHLRFWLRRESWGFAIGSLCFALGALPGYASAVGVSADNATYFLGSLFFTSAGFIQWGLAGGRHPSRNTTSSERLGWWASAIQSAGTLFFNVSTASALVTGLTVEEAERHVWRPDALGSIAFLVASAMAIVAAGKVAAWWDPTSRDWWGGWLNMLGSVAFGVSAVAAYIVPSSGELADAALANLGTFVGAVCFLVAALVVMPRRASGA